MRMRTVLAFAAALLLTAPSAGLAQAGGGAGGGVGTGMGAAGAAGLGAGGACGGAVGVVRAPVVGPAAGPIPAEQQVFRAASAVPQLWPDATETLSPRVGARWSVARLEPGGDRERVL